MLNLLLITMQLYFPGIACQSFTVPPGTCPNDTAQFSCAREDMTRTANTFWTVNGAEYECRVAHSVPNDMDTCGPFESSLGVPVGNSYSSTLTVSSISLNLNGSIVECAGPAPTDVIGTGSICIVGGSSLPPIISNAVISRADVGGGECEVTVGWSDPVISCNGSPSRYVLTVSPPTTECSICEYVVRREDVGFEEREQSVTLTVNQTYRLTVRADTCNNSQTGQESREFMIGEIEERSKSCQYSLEDTYIQAIWEQVSLGPLAEANYTLIINGQREAAMPRSCNVTHCNFTYPKNSSETNYSVSVEAVGCVTRVTECQNVSSAGAGGVPTNETEIDATREVKLKSWHIALLVIGCISFIIGSNIAAVLGSILVLGANSKTDGAIAVLLLIVSALTFPVDFIVCCLVKKRELDEKGVHLKVLYMMLLVASMIITAITVVLWIVLLVYATTNDFADENDAEISVRSNLVIVCFVLSLVVLLEWISRAALWKCGTVGGSETDAPDGSSSPSLPAHPPAASYEEVDVTREASGHSEQSIELKSNEAYGPVEKRIVTSHNQAYGQISL